MLNIKLLQDRVLIETPEETKTSSGLVISKTDDASSFKRGIVVAKGKGRTLEGGDIVPLEVEKGDEVLFSYGENIMIEGKKYSLVKESDIAVILNHKEGCKF